MMNLDDCIEALINLSVDAMVWQWGNCPLYELHQLYVPTGYETYVILAPWHNMHFASIIRGWGLQTDTDAPPYITLRLGGDYHIFIVSSYNKGVQQGTQRQRIVEVTKDGDFFL